MTNKLTPVPVPPIDDQQLYDLIFARHALPMLALALEVGLFEYLAQEPDSLDGLARKLRVTPRAVEAMVAIVAALGFLIAHEDGRFQLTQQALTYLLPTSPFYVGELLRLNDSAIKQLRQAFRRSTESIEPWAVKIEHLPPEEIQGFIDWMHALTLPAASALARQEHFSQVHRLLDVGGGSGSLSLAIAANHPQIQGTIVDLEPVCLIAQSNISACGLEDRIKTLAFDMFCDPWPEDHDAVLFGNIFHAWDLKSCQFLARKAFEVLKPGGTIFLHEMLLNENKDGPLTVACLSAGMLIHEKGKQYTASELKELLTDTGFVGFNTVSTFGYYSLVSARKPLLT